ncbi:MAG: RidA family protein [Betaproteobacteria bacterium]|nr:MAG: RidA family protein [Betaproteobacteria bacterium]
MSIEKLNPPGIAPPVAFYSHLAIVPPDHKLLVFSGQVGNRLDGSFPDSLDEQFEQTISNILALLKSQGAGPEDVVKLSCYVAERPQSYARIGAALRGAFTGTPPAQTFLIVAGLAFPQLKVEIEAIAAVKAG